MYLDQGGGYEEVGGLKCFLPKKPPNNQILGYNLKKKDQKFTRLELPDWYEDRRFEEEYEQEKQQKKVDAGIIKKVTYFDPVCEKFRIDAWKRRLYGLWLFINGKPTYLTGRNTFYLDWCRGDHPQNDGYPIYYDSMRKRFYFRERCQHDPYCLGYVMIGPRGYGKTTEEVSVVLNNMSMPPHRSRAALQSKSEDDARDTIMKGKMIPMFNELPHFFKPQFNHGSNPETYLSFFRTKTGGKKARSVKHGPDYELGNRISIYPAKEKALDGKTLQEVINDEIGKTDPKKESDVYKRMLVNRFTVFRNMQKIGLIRAMTTVEEMDEGGKECFKIWNSSNQDVRTANGFTLSGLYRLFIPDYEITVIPGIVDEFGIVDEQKAIAYHDGERKDREHDAEEYNSYIRKNPRNADEAFITDATKCLFNYMILFKRHQEVERAKVKPYVRGDLYWADGKVDGTVAFKRNDANGKFRMTKILDATGEEYEGSNKLCNNIGYEVDLDGQKQWYPKNDRLFVIGTDPIRFTKTMDGRASKAGAHAFEKYNDSIDKDVPREKWKTHNFIMEYLERPAEPEDYAEDMIMACRYFGCSINPESNVGTLKQHFRYRGYGKFLIVRQDFDDEVMGGKKDDEPYESNTEVIESFLAEIQAFVNRHGHRMPFERTLKQWIDYTIKERTKFDLVPSSGFTLFGARKRIEEDWEEVDLDEVIDVMEYRHGRLTVGEREEVEEDSSLGEWDF